MSNVNGWCGAFGARQEAPVPHSQAHCVPFRTTLWPCSGSPLLWGAAGLISQLIGDYFALLQLNDWGGSQAP